MRYEFEVGDYVKLIANQSLSSHSIGYIGKVAKVQNFPRAEMPGIWYDIDGGGATWSHYSELVPATKAEYEAYHKPKPKFKVGDKVKLVGNSRASRFNIGDILSILEVYLGSNYICYRLGETNSFCPWTNESDLELYTKPQLKVGNWATIVPVEKTLCGHIVEQPKSSSYMKIGCKTISKAEVQTFLNLCEKFDITKVMSGYVKDKSITLDAIKEALK